MKPHCILVTGGCGFIGSHFCDVVLRTTDWDVKVVDSLTYAGDLARLTSLSSYDEKRVDFFKHDLVYHPFGSKTFGDVDSVIHFAAETHVDRSIKYPIKCISDNVFAAMRILEYAREAKPRVVMMVGTDEVYGPAPEGRAFSEWDRYLPSNPYSASKVCCEAVAISYWRTYGVPVVLTNTMNNFGERQHPEKFLPKCVNALLKGEVVPVHSQWGWTDYANGRGDWKSGSRFWIHAQEHAKQLLWLLHEPGLASSYPLRDRPTKFNIVGKKEISNEEIVRIVGDALGVPARWEHVDAHHARPGHDLRYALDGSKMKAFYNRHRVDEPLTEIAGVARWYRDHPEWLEK